MSKICPNCGKMLDDDALFCGECGTKTESNNNIQKRCPSCGTALESDSLFCPECGASVSESGNGSAAAPQMTPPPAPQNVAPNVPPVAPSQTVHNTAQNVPPFTPPQMPQGTPNVPPVAPPPDITVNTGMNTQQTPPPEPPKKDKSGMIACGCILGCFGVFVIAVIIFAVIIYGAINSGALDDTLDDLGIDNDYDYDDIYEEYGLGDISGIDGVEVTPHGNDDNNSENNDNNNDSNKSETGEYMFSDLADTDDFEYLYLDDFAQEPPVNSVNVLDNSQYLGEWKVCYFSPDSENYSEKYLILYVEEDFSQDTSNYTGIPVKAQVRPSVSVEGGEYEDISYEETYYLTGVAYIEGENTYLYLADENDSIFNLMYLYNYSDKQYSSGYYYDSASQTLFNCEMVRP